jgi:hypothetical protein
MNDTSIQRADSFSSQANGRLHLYAKRLIDRTLLFVLIAGLVSSGCTTSRQFYLRNETTGKIEGPFRCQEGSRVLGHRIDFPKPDELQLVQTLQHTMLPEFSVDEVEITHAVEVLNELLAERSEHSPLQIGLNLEGYLRPGFPEDYDAFLTSGFRKDANALLSPFQLNSFVSYPDDLSSGFGLSVKQIEEGRREYDGVKVSIPRVSFECHHIDVYTALNYLCDMAGLFMDTNGGAVVLRPSNTLSQSVTSGDAEGKLDKHRLKVPEAYPYDESIAKGVDLRVPAEFVHGTATLDQASRWANAFHDTVQDKQPLYYDICGSDEKEVLFKHHHSQGNSSYASYIAFTKVKTGYQFIGIITGSISNGKFSVLQP